MTGEKKLLAKRLKAIDATLAAIMPKCKKREYGFPGKENATVRKQMLADYRELLTRRKNIIDALGQDHPLQKLKQRGTKVKPKGRRRA